MDRIAEHFERNRQGNPAAAVLALLVLGGIAGNSHAQTPLLTMNTETQRTTSQSKFYCNVKALNPTERTHHKRLTEKLISSRKEIVEMEKGYEFQFSPSAISAVELADWVTAESKCCPFFDFHIDLEREGKLLCLRLAGEEGIKPFIQSEFQVRPK